MSDANKNNDSALKFLIILLLIVTVVNTGVLLKLLIVEKQQVNLLQAQVEVSREDFLGNLLQQYYADLNACMLAVNEGSGMTDEECIEEINNSELASKVTKWGGEEYLIK